MRLFINDIPVRIVNTSKDLSKEFYHDTIDANQEIIQQNRLVHHVLIVNMNISHLDELLHSLHKYILSNLYSLTIVVADLNEVTTYLNKKYKII